jgi:hypothetical protein
MRRLVWGLTALVLVGGCGKKNAGPGTSTTPTPVAPTVVGLTLSPAFDLIMLAATQPVTATASFSDGSSSGVTPTWSVSPAQVATVSGGTITATAAGEATITADYQGARATRQIRVLPNFAGQWTGRFRIASCTDALDFRGVCDGEDLTTFYRIAAALTQNVSDVSGTVSTYEDAPTHVNGTISVDGTLNLSGPLSYSIGGIAFEERIADWRTTTANNQTMAGTFSIVLTAPKYQGEVRWMCELESASKVPGVPGVAGVTSDHSTDRFRRPRPRR